MDNDLYPYTLRHFHILDDMLLPMTASWPGTQGLHRRNPSRKSTFLRLGFDAHL